VDWQARLKLKLIFGRITAFIPVKGLMDEGDVAEFFPCPGQPFDLIFFDPKFPNPKQGLLHEEFHAVCERMGLNQTELSHDLQERICEVLSVYVTEMYHLREK
jgi:hypothetical protein